MNESRLLVEVNLLSTCKLNAMNTQCNHRRKQRHVNLSHTTVKEIVHINMMPVTLTNDHHSNRCGDDPTM